MRKGNFNPNDSILQECFKKSCIIHDDSAHNGSIKNDVREVIKNVTFKTRNIRALNICVEKNVNRIRTTYYPNPDNMSFSTEATILVKRDVLPGIYNMVLNEKQSNGGEFTFYPINMYLKQIDIATLTAKGLKTGDVVKNAGVIGILILNDFATIYDINGDAHRVLTLDIEKSNFNMLKSITPFQRKIIDIFNEGITGNKYYQRIFNYNRFNPAKIESIIKEDATLLSMTSNSDSSRLIKAFYNKFDLHKTSGKMIVVKSKK